MKKDFDKECCQIIDGNLFIKNDVSLNYLTVMRISNVFSKISQYCCNDLKTDGYYDIARAAWEYDNNGVVRVFARENGLDCSWRYDPWYKDEGCSDELECAKKHLGCDVEIVIKKEKDAMTIDIYIRSNREYLKEWCLNSPYSSFVNALRDCCKDVNHHKYVE